MEIQIEEFQVGDDGRLLIKCSGGHVIKLDTMAMQSLIGALSSSLPNVASHELAKPQAAPNVDHLSVELGTKWGTEILRIFLSPQVYHEYAVPSDTNVGRYFRALGDQISADQESQALPPPLTRQ